VHACRWSASSNLQPGFKAMLDELPEYGLYQFAAARLNGIANLVNVRF
jgi:hypothetical protein